MPDQLADAIRTHQAAFGLDLADDAIAKLEKYYELINEHNPLLHLVGPCSADEFAVRHILESLVLLKHLPRDARFADVGTGAGLPSIPCLLVREDLKAVLIESKEKKARFLHTVVKTLDLQPRATIANRQFEEVDPADCRFVTCRALDKFSEKLARLAKWAGPREMLLFAGPGLKTELEKLGFEFRTAHLPLSEQRFLFEVAAGTGSAN
jgi:16S rRNA (guanine527-N7)-methyltransferase